MDNDQSVRHYHPIAMTNDQRLEVSELMVRLKEANVIPGNMNLGQFVTDCFMRGFNEYRKEMNRVD
ncbi:MAG: hypothetical protein ACO4CH_09195 [Saprospiraceae bacterium]